MFGSSGSRCARTSTVGKLKFEQLDERTVLSAVSPLALDAALDAARELDLDAAAVPAAAPAGLDGRAFMQGTNYTFSIGDFGFTDGGNSPPDNFAGVRIASLPAQGNLTAFGSGVAVGQIISAQAIQSGELRYANAGIERTPYATLTFQVQDDGDPNTGDPNIDPTPNAFTLFYDDQRIDFVRNLYQDILERQAETAGLTGWIDQIVDGTPNSQIVAGLRNSFEHRAIQVDGYYDQFFDRVADPLGRQYWIDQMRGGMSEADVMTALLSTEEYRLNNPSNEAFLAAVYGDILNRSLDSNGQQYWLNEMSSGRTRETVASLLVNTRERHINLVIDYYDEFYSRLPDGAGVEFWVDQLNRDVLDDGGVAEALLITPEYLLQQP